MYIELYQNTRRKLRRPVHHAELRDSPHKKFTAPRLAFSLFASVGMIFFLMEDIQIFAIKGLKRDSNS